MIDLPPEPPVPDYIDLRAYPDMPLGVARLRGSDMHIEVTPEEGWYGLQLWCAAWHQIPASSLPNDDAKLAYLAGLGRDLRTWKRVRSGALRGFVACSDGRLYHPVIAEKAMVAWKSMKHGKVAAEARWKTANELKTNKTGNARAYAQHDARGDAGTPSEHMPNRCPTDAQPMPRREGKGREGKGREESTTAALLSTEATAREKQAAADEGWPKGVGSEKVNEAEPVREIPKVEPKPAGINRETAPAVDLETSNPKHWPAALVAKTAAKLADKLWTYLDADARRDAYRMTGAAEDVRLVRRWMEAGFSQAEIKGAAEHVGMSTPGNVENPVRFLSKMVPVYLARKRDTGSYEEPRPATAGTSPAAGRPTPRGAPRTDNDEIDAFHERKAAEKARAMQVLPRWLRNGRRGWPIQGAGSEPGTGGSYISQNDIRQAEISLGIRTD